MANEENLHRIRVQIDTVQGEKELLKSNRIEFSNRTNKK